MTGFCESGRRIALNESLHRAAVFAGGSARHRLQPASLLIGGGLRLSRFAVA